MPYRERPEATDEDDQLTRAMAADQKDRLRYGGGYGRPQASLTQIAPSGRAEPPDLVIPGSRKSVAEDVVAVMEPPTKMASVSEPGQKPERQE